MWKYLRSKLLALNVKGQNSMVTSLRIEGRYQDAMPLAIRAVSAASNLGEKHPQYAISLNNLAGLYKSMGDYQQAEPLFRRAKEICHEVFGEKHPYYAASLNNLAELYRSMGDYQQAEPLYLKAREIYREILGEKHSYYAMSLNNLALLYYSMGDFKQAETLYLNAKEIDREALGEKHPHYAADLNNLAGLYKSMGDFKQAESLFRQTKEIFREVLGEKHVDYATSLNNLATVYNLMGDYQQAETLFRRAKEISQEVFGEKHPQYAASLNNLAELYRSMGDYQQAETLFRQAKEIRHEVLGGKHLDYAASLNSLAELYRLMGDYQQAEPLCLKAKEIRREVLGEKHPDYAISLNNLAGLYELVGDFKQAEPLYLKAKEICREVLGEKHVDYAASLNNLAGLYCSTGDYQQAEPLYRQAKEISREVLGEKHPHYAGSLSNLALLLAATERNTEILDLVKRVADIHNYLIGQIFAMGSERQRTSFVNTIEPEFFNLLSLLCYAVPKSATATQTALEIVLRRKAIRAEALMAQRDSVLGGSYPHLAPKLYELAKWREQIALKTLAGPGQEGLEAHNQIQAEWESQKEVLEAELARQIPEINLEQKLREIDRQVVAMALPEESALIEFVCFDVFDFKAVPAGGESQWKPAHYLAFILPAGKPDDLQMIDLGEAEGIDRMIATFRTAVTREQEGRGVRDLGFVPREADSDLFIAQGKELRAILFDKLLDGIGGCKRLFIAPDGDLTRLPFEILPTDDGEFLIDKYRISYLGVGRDLIRFGAASSGQPTAPIVAADPDFDLADGNPQFFQPEDKPTSARISRDFDRSSLHFTRLPGTRIEGENIAEMLDVEPLLEAEAVESQIKSCRSPRILHIATHGFFLKDQKRDLNLEQRGLGAIESGAPFGMARLTDSKLENPLLRSGLVLAGVNTYLKNNTPPAEAEDGILTAEDVSGLDLLATELVVLSACETGLGEVSLGEGVFGLRRAFVLAGAKTMVMSLWKVPDKQTQELMETFYQKILFGQPRSEALREAQLEIRKKNPHPLYWGAFICQGDPNQLNYKR